MQAYSYRDEAYFTGVAILQRESAVPAKYKILSALAIVVATKCEPCNKGYTKMAYDAGTTETELVEFLNTAITESGCPGELWAMIALKTYGDLHAGKKVDAAEICCRDENPNWRETIVKDLVCYCFEYSADDICSDYEENGKSTIMEKIQMEKRFGNCQCATKNPKGKWCLGDVRQVVEKLKDKQSFNVIEWYIECRKAAKWMMMTNGPVK